MRRLNDDRGAAAITVAVFGVVLLVAMSALAVDASAAYVERRELQNGADAAALAIAQDCAADRAECITNEATADEFANGNAQDGFADAYSVTFEGNSVTVKVRTSDGVGSNLPSWLSLSDEGKRSENGTVHAQATVSWGGTGGLAKGFPITLSKCEWDTATGGGDTYAPTPSSPLPATNSSDWNGYAVYEKTIVFHDSAAAGTCNEGGAGADLPGGFGWLKTDGECSTASEADGWLDDKPGVRFPSDCVASDIAPPKLMFVPVYDGVNGLTGANGSYHVAGYAAFVVTAYNFPSVGGGGINRRASFIPGTTSTCGTGGGASSTSCLAGFFTQALVPTSSSGGGPDMGSISVWLSN